MKKTNTPHIVVLFRDGRRAEYPVDTLNYIPGDRDVVDVIDAETGEVIYIGKDGYINPDYRAYFDAPMINPLDLFRAAVNV